MPWQNNGGSGGPWGGGGDSGPPKNPWGEKNPPPKQPGNGDRSTPDFDEFIRRSQERLRASFNGGGSGGSMGGRGNVPWALIFGSLVLLWAVFTSSYRVGPQEKALLLRFGKYVETVGPGLHFKFPAPVDSVFKENTEENRSIDIGAGEKGENLMLTGDQNIINVAYTIRWKIKDLAKYRFELAEPDSTVQEVAESAMRAEMAHADMNAAIGSQRAQIAEQVRNRMQEILNGYQSGVEIVGVDIRNADPPAAVDDAFKEVTASQQKAQEYLSRARAYAQQTIARAQGETAQFNALYAQYRLAPEVTRKRIYLDTMEDVVKKNDKTIIDSRGVAPYLPLPGAIRGPVAPAATQGGAK
jgi:membrane protease subunit HflK